MSMELSNLTLLIDGDSHQPRVIKKEAPLNAIETVSVLPYGLCEYPLDVDNIFVGKDTSLDEGVEMVLKEDSLPLKLSYNVFRDLFDMDLSSTLLPISQAERDKDFESSLSLVSGSIRPDVQEISFHLESAQNSTSSNRRNAKAGIRGNIHNQPIVPGRLSHNAPSDVDKENEDCESVCLVDDTCLSLLHSHVTENMMLSYNSSTMGIDGIPSVFCDKPIPDLIVEGLSLETQDYEGDYFSSATHVTPTIISNQFISFIEPISNNIDSIPSDIEVPPMPLLLPAQPVVEHPDLTKPAITKPMSILRKSNENLDLCSLNVKANKLLAIMVSRTADFVQNIENTDMIVSKTDKKSWGILDNSDMTNFREIVPHMAQEFPFELDDFQKRSIVHLERGESVYVCAHTSAGKTVVADYAISLCQSHMTKCIYTSPVKALSNQKYHDFKEKYEDVGIITGDVSVNPTAGCLIMTTEILREMLYNGSDVIRDVEWVIFDEAHYINDADRGVVWEESIILLPDHISMALLSATTPNVMEIADWIGRSKQRMIYIMSTLYRPVPLEYNILYQGKETCIKDVNNIYHPEKIRVLHGNGPNENSKDNKPIMPASVLMPSSKEITGLIRVLKKNDDMPCIVFTLGRRLCNESARICSKSKLISDSESAYVRSFYSKCISNLRKEDQSLLQVQSLLKLLQNGVGIHHAGLLPLLKEVVEMLFSAGYIKILFATETFAIGVNMPAKSVCFNGIGKFDGIGRRYFLPSEFTQMAGRAGRRGKDILGRVYMLVRDLPSVSTIMNVVGVSSDAIESKFKIDYSMILNILRVQDLSLENILSHSFSEAARLRELDEMHFAVSINEINSLMIALKAKLEAQIGDKTDNFLVMEETKKERQRFTLSSAIREMTSNIWINRKGRDDIITKGRFVIADITFPSIDGLCYVDETVCMLYVCNDDFSSIIVLAYTPHTINSIPQNLIVETSVRMNIAALCGKYVHNNGRYIFITRIALGDIINVVSLISSVYAKSSRMTTTKPVVQPSQLVGELMQELPPLYESCVVMQCKDKLLKLPSSVEEIEYDKDMNSLFKRGELRGIAKTYLSLNDKQNEMKEAMSTKKLNLLPELNARIAVLKNLMYVSDDDLITVKGRCCCYIRSGNELLLMELLFENVFTTLTPPEVAAVLSVMIFEREDDDNTVLRNPRLKEISNKMKTIVSKTATLERECGMKDVDVIQSVKDRVHVGFMEIAYNWCRGMPFNEVMVGVTLDEGFVVNQLLRTEAVCRKLSEVACEIGSSELRFKCEEVSQAMMRDIVFTPSLYLST